MYFNLRFVGVFKMKVSVKQSVVPFIIFLLASLGETRHPHRHLKHFAPELKSPKEFRVEQSVKDEDLRKYPVATANGTFLKEDFFDANDKSDSSSGESKTSAPSTSEETKPTTSKHQRIEGMYDVDTSREEGEENDPIDYPELSLESQSKSESISKEDDSPQSLSQSTEEEFLNETMDATTKTSTLVSVSSTPTLTTSSTLETSLPPTTTTTSFMSPETTTNTEETITNLMETSDVMMSNKKDKAKCQEDDSCENGEICVHHHCVKSEACPASMEGKKRLCTKSMSFQNYEHCLHGQWRPKACSSGTLFWNSLSCCVDMSKFPCVANCHSKL